MAGYGAVMAQGSLDQDTAASGRRWARPVVLAGWAAKGVVYLALAWLVLQMAFGRAPQQATTTGALEYLAATAPGSVGLIVLGIGLLAYALGRVLEVTVLARPSVGAADRIMGFALAFVYAGLAVSAFAIVGLVSSSASGGSGGSQGTAPLLGLPGGRWLVALIGLAVAALGLHTLYGGVERKFLATLRTGEMSGGVRAWAERIGVVAYVTKGAIFLLFAWFLVQSAVTHDPSDAATGLDGALRRVSDATWGTVLLAAIAVGLFAYGAFCEIEARYRRVGASATGTA